MQLCASLATCLQSTSPFARDTFTVPPASMVPPPVVRVYEEEGVLDEVEMQRFTHELEPVGSSNNLAQFLTDH